MKVWRIRDRHTGRFCGQFYSRQADAKNRLGRYNYGARIRYEVVEFDLTEVTRG
jgi:hypothetical protein